MRLIGQNFHRNPIPEVDPNLAKDQFCHNQKFPIEHAINGKFNATIADTHLISIKTTIVFTLGW